MPDRKPGGLNDRYRDCLRGDPDHEHKSSSTATTHAGRIRERIYRSLVDGALQWIELSEDQREKIFNPVDNAGTGPGTTQQHDPGELEKVDRLHRGIIGWLAFLYRGVGDADNIFIPAVPNHEITEDGEAIVAPNYHFDFETMLREAVIEAEARRGRRVTNFELKIETETGVDPEVAEPTELSDGLSDVFGPLEELTETEE